MSAITENIPIEKGFGPAIISNQVKSHANDSLVIKKIEKAIKTLKNTGLPDNSTKK